MKDLTPIICRLKPDEQAAAMDILVEGFGEKNRQFAIPALAAGCVENTITPASFTAKIDGRIVGHIQVTGRESTPDGFAFLWLTVAAAHRNRGIGAALIKHVENYVLDNCLNGKTSSMVLVAEYRPSYYEKLGYEDTHKPHNGHPVLCKPLSC